MRLVSVLSCVGLLASTSALTGVATPGNLPVPKAPAPTEAKAAASVPARRGLAKLSTGFEANRGQTDPQVRFLTRGPGFTLLLTAEEAILKLARPGQAATKDRAEVSVLRMRLVGAAAAPRTDLEDPLPGRSNYIIGNEPSRWTTDVQRFDRLVQRQVYDGIDVAYYANAGGELEYDFLVAPGADPRSIRIAFSGADDVRLDAQGNLVLRTKGGDVIQRAPVAYQEHAGGRRAVDVRFRQRGHEVTFALGAYDHERPLVIDPVLSYASYLGSTDGDVSHDIAVAPDGTAYLLLLTSSARLPLVNAYDSTVAPSDAYVAKIHSSGTYIEYATYFGGTDGEAPRSIAVDGAGQALVTGTTFSEDFPVVNAFQPTFAGGSIQEAFVTKLAATGSALVFSSYAGGTSYDEGFGAAYDSDGNGYVTGVTDSPDFPFFNALGPFQNFDAFVIKLDPSGARIYATPVGGNGADYGRSIAADAAGNAYVAGNTSSSAATFPLVSAFQGAHGGGGYDAFLTILSPNGSAITYSTFLGGGGSDIGRSVAVSGSGAVILGGSTDSANFPVSSALQGTRAGTEDGFVAGFSAGGGLLYSTYFGGARKDAVSAVAADAAGGAILGGWTLSSDLPVVNPTQAACTSGGVFDEDGFVARIGAGGSPLAFSTYVCGSDEDFVESVGIDAAGALYASGFTWSTDLPVANPMQEYKVTIALDYEAFLLRIVDPPAGPSLSVANTKVMEGASGTTSLVFDVTLADPTGGTVTVDYATLDGTALSSSDYTAASGSVTFSGATTVQTVTVTVAGDGAEERNETLGLRLMSPSGAALARQHAIGTILNDDGAFITIDDVTKLETDSGTVAYVFRVTPSQPFNSTVYYQTRDVTATGGVDYLNSGAGEGGSVLLSGGTSQFVFIEVVGDLRQEPTETFKVVLTEASGATIADDTGIGTIVDDGDPVPSLSIANATLTEGNSGSTVMNLNVAVSPPSGYPITVEYASSDVTATAGSDYTAVSGTLTIPANTASMPIAVQVQGDILDEATETFVVDLSSATNATIGDGQGIGTITDNDTATIAAGGVTVAEGDGSPVSAVFNVTLSTPSVQTVTVDYAMADVTATTGSDYTPVSGSLTFPPGTTAQTVTASVIGDVLDEANETFNLNLTNATGATISDAQGVGTITDDDAMPSLSVDDVTVTEGNGGTVTATFTVTLSAVSGRTVTVNRATANATATAGSDYVALTIAALTFPAGTVTQTVSVTVNGDTADEPNETFFLNLSSPGSATLADGQGLGTINDDDDPALSVNNATVTEGNTGSVNAVFTVSLSSAATQPVTVGFTTTDATAAAGADYTAQAGTLTFAAGTTSQTVTVAVLGETLDEGTETFTLDLSGPVNATIADGQGLGTITDNDTATIAAGNVTVTEGDSGTVDAIFNVTLTVPSAQTVTVSYAMADVTAITGTDYTPASGTLTFAPGTTAQTATAVVIADILDEANETFQLNLSAASGATVSDAQGIGTITDDDATPTLSVNDVTVTEGNAGPTTATFTVTLSAVSGRTVTVNRATANSTATAGTDYVALASAALTFPAGTTTQTVAVTVNGDVVDEINEAFFVNLTSPVNATLADGQGVGTITDDDDPALSVNNVTVTEGNTGSLNAVFTVSLSTASTQDVTVAFTTTDVTATAGADYTAQAGTLTFAAGTTTQTVPVAVLDETLDESTETFTFDLSSPVNATMGDGQGLGTITDNDTATIAAGNVTVTEGNSGSVGAVFNVTLTVPSAQTVIVEYSTSEATATAGADFTGIAGILTFASGATLHTVTAGVVGDTLDEANETFNLNLTNPSGAAISDPLGLGTITDDDAAPTLSITDLAVAEGDSGTMNAVFTVTLSAASGRAVTVNRATGAGTATAGTDYTALPVGGLTFPAGTTTQTVTVTVNGDTVDEANETFLVNLTSPLNATFGDGQATGTITDDDNPDASISDVTVAEGNTGSVNAVFTVTLSAAGSVQSTVAYATVNGTATAGSDYTAASGTLTFAPGATSQTITVPVTGDTVDEADETFTVQLSAAVNLDLADALGLGTITDNDAVSLSIADTAIVEGNAGPTAGSAQVTLSAAAGRTVTVDYASSGGTATAGTDYTSVSGTLTFAPGTTTAPIPLTLQGDLLDEENETFILTLSNAPGATLADATATVTITDDDAAPSLSADDLAQAEGQSGTTPAVFTVRLSVASGRTVTVAAATADGTATAGSDYAAASGTLTFLPGATTATFAVSVLGDATTEPDETLFLGLTTPVNATLAGAPARGVILDDDAGLVAVRELAHASSARETLAAGPGPEARENWYRMRQQPRASYEVVVDAVSGNALAGAGVLVQRVDASGVAVAEAVVTGTGAARSLRWQNGGAAAVTGEIVRVTGPGCGAACASPDGYRIRAYETTYAVPRFNNAGSQVTVLVVQNTGDQTVNGTVHFWHSAGTLLDSRSFTVASKATFALNTSTVAGAAGQSGVLTIVNDGRYGDLAGKTVALEATTGFSFDTPMLPRPR